MRPEAVMVLGKELRRFPDRALRELRARSAAAATALDQGAQRIFTLEAHMRGQDRSGSALVAEMLAELGVPPERVHREEHTTSTRGEVLAAAALRKKHGFDRLLLITAAYHLPRAQAYAAEVDPRLEVAAPERFLQVASPLARRWILEGISDPRAYAEELPVERTFRVLWTVLAPLPPTLRWRLEEQAGALFRRAGD